MKIWQVILYYRDAPEEPLWRAPERVERALTPGEAVVLAYHSFVEHVQAGVESADIRLLREEPPNEAED